MKTNKTSRTQGTPQQFLSAVQDKIIELGGSDEPSEVLSSSTTDKLKRGVAMKRGTPDQFKMELTAKIAELGGDVSACDAVAASEDIDPGKLERYIHNLMGSISDLLEEEGYNVGFDDTGESLVISIYPVGEERCDGEYTFPKSALQVANGSDPYTDAYNIVEILMGRGHFEDFYATTEIVASDDLTYDYYDFDVDGDEYDWSEEWTEVKSKSVPDSDGFMTDYTMYRNRADGSFIFMFGDKEINIPSADYADWSAETEKEANEWFDNYNGFEDEDEDIDDVQLFDEIPEVQNFKQAVNDADTVDDIELLIQGLSDGVAEDYVTSDLNSALNETDDIGQIKYAVINSISLYLEDNEWLGDDE